MKCSTVDVMRIVLHLLYGRRAIYSRNHHTISIVGTRRNECGVNCERHTTQNLRVILSAFMYLQKRCFLSTFLCRFLFVIFFLFSSFSICRFSQIDASMFLTYVKKKILILLKKTLSN